MRRSVDRPVVLAGSGRCGSTLLQSVLNTNQDFLIWGEHNGFLRHVAESYYGAPHPRFPDRLQLSSLQRIKRLRDARHWPAWDNLCGEAEFRERYRDFLKSFFADPAGQAKRWGFKEIRYGNDAGDQTLRLLFECFPETRLIIVIREPLPTIFSILSRWVFADQRNGDARVDDLDQQILAVADSWNERYMQLRSLLETYAPNSLALHYEDLASAQTQRRLASFLDTSSFDYQRIIAKVKDASNKTDPTALLIRSRMELLGPRIVAATCKAREAYGYLPASSKPSVVHSSFRKS